MSERKRERRAREKQERARAKKNKEQKLEHYDVPFSICFGTSKYFTMISAPFCWLTLPSASHARGLPRFWLLMGVSWILQLHRLGTSKNQNDPKHSKGIGTRPFRAFFTEVCDGEPAPSADRNLCEGALGWQRLSAEVGGGQGQEIWDS